jgi:hypothetical protein
MSMLPRPDHWFLEMTVEEAREIIKGGHCKVGPDCGCWWNRRLASAQHSMASIMTEADVKVALKEGAKVRAAAERTRKRSPRR